MKQVNFFIDGIDLRKFIADYELKSEKQAIGDAVTKWNIAVGDFDLGLIKFNDLERIHEDVCCDIYDALAEIGKARLTLCDEMECECLCVFDDAVDYLNHIGKDFSERFK